MHETLRLTEHGRIHSATYATPVLTVNVSERAQSSPVDLVNISQPCEMNKSPRHFLPLTNDPRHCMRELLSVWRHREPAPYTWLVVIRDTAPHMERFRSAHYSYLIKRELDREPLLRQILIYDNHNPTHVLMQPPHGIPAAGRLLFARAVHCTSANGCLSLLCQKLQHTLSVYIGTFRRRMENPEQSFWLLDVLSPHDLDRPPFCQHEQLHILQRHVGHQ